MNRKLLNNKQSSAILLMRKYTAVDSSMIDVVGYNEESQTLEIRFINSGITYKYYDLPKEEYQKLLNASSKGIYMREQIIDRYDYSKWKGKRKKVQEI